MKTVNKFTLNLILTLIPFFGSCSDNENYAEVYQGEIINGTSKHIYYPKNTFPKFFQNTPQKIYYSELEDDSISVIPKRKIFTFDTKSLSHKEFLDINTELFSISNSGEWLVFIDEVKNLYRFNIKNGTKELIDFVDYHSTVPTIDSKEKYIAYSRLDENDHSEVCVTDFEGDSLICFEESISPNWHPSEEKLIFSKGTSFLVYNFTKNSFEDTIYVNEELFSTNPFYLADGNGIVFENEKGVWFIDENGEISNLFTVSDYSFAMKFLSPNPNNSRSFLFEGFIEEMRVNAFEPIITGERAFYIFNVDSILSKK